MNGARVLNGMVSLISVMVALCLVVAPPSPALAQESSADVQYVGGGADDFADNTEQGTDAVNDALNDGEGASASPRAVLSAETGTSTDNSSSTEASETEDDGEGLDSISELPETGGAPLLVLCAGVALLGCGLLVRRVAL